MVCGKGKEERLYVLDTGDFEFAANIRTRGFASVLLPNVRCLSPFGDSRSFDRGVSKLVGVFMVDATTHWEEIFQLFLKILSYPPSTIIEKYQDKQLYHR